MAKRKVVEIDGRKCNGCGRCIPGCHEGALQIVGGKARLVDSVYCDGLGNCLGHCPRGAIRIVEKDVAAFDLEKTSERLRKNALKGVSCPGAAARKLSAGFGKSALSQWPVQLALLPPNAPFFEGSWLLVCADCVPFATARFHQKLLKGRSIVIGCPKLDDVGSYQEKIREMLKLNRIKGVTVAIMEVPCCWGLYAAVEAAVKEGKKRVPLEKVVVGVSGEILEGK